MKTKILLAILICSLFSGNLFAQKNLNSIKADLDKDKDVKKSEIIKSAFFEMTSYSIDNEKQINKILQAFEKDKKDANRVVNREKSENNTNIMSQTFTFNNNGEEINYTIDKKGDNKASFQYRIISRDKAKGKIEEYFPNWKDWENYGLQMQADIFRNLDSLKIKYPNFDSLKIHLPDLKNINQIFNKKTKYVISENGYITINGEKLSAEEARKLGYDVETIPESEIKLIQEKPKFFIPKDSYIIINGKKINAEEARKLGYDVETF